MNIVFSDKFSTIQDIKNWRFKMDTYQCIYHKSQLKQKDCLLYDLGVNVLDEEVVMEMSTLLANQMIQVLMHE